jgi:hypothetical protein
MGLQITIYFESTIYSKLDNHFPARATDFLFSKGCKLDLGPTWPVQCAMRVSFSGGKAARA